MLRSWNDEIVETENKFWLLVVTRRREYEERVCVYERMMRGTLVEMETLCVLTRNVSVLVVILF